MKLFKSVGSFKLTDWNVSCLLKNITIWKSILHTAFEGTLVDKNVIVLNSANKNPEETGIPSILHQGNTQRKY